MGLFDRIVFVGKAVARRWQRGDGPDRGDPLEDVAPPRRPVRRDEDDADDPPPVDRPEVEPSRPRKRTL